nr:F-box/kelch-repeat protein At3g23880-like [Coffea arabica]
MRKGKRSRVARPEHIPEDIIVEILSRLPVKTLMKFKIVCNQWKSLISHKIFSLRNDARCREKPLFFFRRSNKDLTGTKVSTYWSLNSDLHVEEFDNPFSEYEFLGSCDGLLLFGYGKNICLWNPSTRYSRAVHHLLSLGHGYRRVLASGFCYDDSVDDYKVVIIISQPRKSEPTIYAFVSHLKSITWTKVICPYEVLRTDWVAPLMRGNLHILAQEKEGKNGGNQRPNAPQQLILCFDTKRDEFKLWPKPDPKHDEQNLVHGLGVIEGCLCMVRPDTYGWEVLTMREYGVKESWTVLFTIVNSHLNAPRYSLVPVFLTNKGEVVMVENHQKVLAYDLKSRNLLDVRQQKYPESSQLFGFPYVESVADGNQERPPRRKRNNRLDDFIYFSYLDHL